MEIGKCVEIRILGKILHVLAGGVEAEALDDMRPDQAKAQPGTALEEVAKQQVGQEMAAHFERVDIAAIGHRAAATLVVPVAKQSAQRRIIEGRRRHGMAVPLQCVATSARPQG